MRQKSLQSCRHNLPEVEPGPMPGAHLPGAKPLVGSFAMSKFAGDSAPGKRTFAKTFCILPGLLPLANCQIFYSGRSDDHERLKKACHCKGQTPEAKS
ncbi:hypothetical protein MTR_2g042070 [Medicago truncatula]|uniref:Uncharacterized protein n=1 Tax=Medicago truncatula TaxID=3880 RepID=G7IGD5_MEDTR|nr:hypothetical protein MTR_2g042070 [Medicago truncatula]